MTTATVEEQLRAALQHGLVSKALMEAVVETLPLATQEKYRALVEVAGQRGREPDHPTIRPIQLDEGEIYLLNPFAVSDGRVANSVRASGANIKEALELLWKGLTTGLPVDSHVRVSMPEGVYRRGKWVENVWRELDRP